MSEQRRMKDGRSQERDRRELRRGEDFRRRGEGEERWNRVDRGADSAEWRSLGAANAVVEGEGSLGYDRYIIHLVQVLTTGTQKSGRSSAGSMGVAKLT
eukprot:749465-Hanusia_phi.AAC.3